MFFSCTGEFVYTNAEYGAEPIIIENGIYESVIGYETVEVDTSFYYSGHPADLTFLDLDYFSCRRDYCTGSYTETVELVEQSYELTIRNDGWDPAYGLTADIRMQTDDGYHVTVHTETLYISERLDPDYEVYVSFPLNGNETVLSFEGLDWDEYDVYMKKTQEKPNYKGQFSKAAQNDKVKIALAKSGTKEQKKRKCIKTFKTGKLTP